jgi:hypothetical protein
VNLQAINDKSNGPPMWTVKRTLAIIELFAQSIHDRLALVTAFRRRVQVITYFVAGGCKCILLFIPG